MNQSNSQFIFSSIMQQLKKDGCSVYNMTYDGRYFVSKGKLLFRRDASSCFPPDIVTG